MAIHPSATTSSMASSSKPSSKNALEIRLTESVVFLRNGDATGRRRSANNGQSGMVRGLLTLNLAKPTRISSIEIELVCRTSTSWPEGIGARRIDVTEEHKLYSQSYVFFDANAAPVLQRRTMSVGPGLIVDHDQEDDNRSDEQHQASTFTSEPDTERRGRELTRGRNPLPRHTSANAHNSHFQPGYVNHINDQLPTPPYSPRYSPEGTPTHSLSRRTSGSLRSPMRTVDEVPENGQPLEELRNALRDGLSFEQNVLSPPSRVSSPPRLRSTSRHPSSLLSSPVLRPSISRTRSGQSTEEGSSSDVPAIPNLSPVSPHGPAEVAHSRATSPNTTHDDIIRGRNSKRFTLAGVSTAIFEAISDRVRSVSHHAGDITPPRDRTRDRTRDRPLERSRERRHSPDPKHKGTLSRVGEALGLETEEGKEYGDGWKEFKAGVYTYPISFAIPADSAPSLSCEYGSVIWRLKAHAHRPGAFAAKLTAIQDVTVVTAPGEDDTEETENVIVERQWDDQMQYLLTISGRSFPIGGSIPITLTFIPWAKMKIFRLSVILEERIDYLTQFKRVARTDTISRVPLLSLSPTNKDAALLPLQGDDVDSFLRSPLHALLGPNDDASSMASEFMGPGPWTIQQDVALPESCNTIHFTNKNKKSNIVVSHLLKIIFRVQRHDDPHHPEGDNKRKLYDIVVQTPVHILSCLCSPDYTALPPYTVSSTSQLSSLSDHSQYYCPRGHPHPGPHSLSSSISAPGPSSTRRAYSRQPSSAQDLPSDLHFTSADSSVSSPQALSRHDSAFDRNSQYERLMTGQETASGEAPPAYETVVSVSSSTSSST